MRKFFEVIQLVNEPQAIKTDCGDFTIINNGTSNAILNGVTIVPGAQYVTRANEGELNVTQYTLGFDNTGTNSVIVVRKIYNNG
jgi:hypothetical protein